MIAAIISRIRAARDARNRETVEAAWDAAHSPATRAYDLWAARKAHLADAQRRHDTRDIHYWTRSVARAQRARLELGA